MNQSISSKIRKAITYRSLKFINGGLHHLELALNRQTIGTLPHPPIFIIGAPRSGSTLLYQVLTDYYNVGYLSNLHCTFYGAPSFVEYLFHPEAHHQPSDYTSFHGQTHGWFAPSECGEFWYRFFHRKPPYVPRNDFDPKMGSLLRKVIYGLTKASGKSILFKNLYCTVRLHPIADTFPEALYVVVRRNLLGNAHSILEGRQKTYGDYNTWWSVEPPDVDKLKTLPAHQQAVEQVRSINNLIEQSMPEIGPHKFIDISYEDLCASPHETLKRLEGFFSDNNLLIERRIMSGEIPKSFPESNTIRIEPEIYQKMIDYIAKVET